MDIRVIAGGFDWIAFYMEERKYGWENRLGVVSECSFEKNICGMNTINQESA